MTCSHLSGLLAHVATATDVVSALEIRVMEAEEFLVYGTVGSGLSLVGFESEVIWAWPGGVWKECNFSHKNDFQILEILGY